MRFAVDIIESERGWGQRVDERKFFNSADEAWTFVEQFNADNNAAKVPDWYMYAMEPVKVD